MDQQDFGVQIPETQGSFEALQEQLERGNRRSQQNLLMGAVAGLAAAVCGAAIWALVTVMTGYQIGWLAVGLGFLVGFAIRIFGKGVDPIFPILGGGLALLGCLFGNYLAVIGLVSKQEAIPFFSLLTQIDVPTVFSIMKSNFSPIDFLFYGFAAYEGFRFAKLPEEKIAEP